MSKREVNNCRWKNCLDKWVHHKECGYFNRLSYEKVWKIVQSIEESAPVSSSKKEIIADKIIAAAMKKIASEKQLRPIGSGGQMLDQIQMLAIGFQYFEKVSSIDTARELLIYAVDTFMKEVNNNEEILHYLKNYPFTPKNVEIRIFCYQSNGSTVALHELEYISSIEGMLKYYPRGRDSNKMEEPILTETYENAIKKLKYNKPIS